MTYNESMQRARRTDRFRRRLSKGGAVVALIASMMVTFAAPGEAQGEVRCSNIVATMVGTDGPDVLRGTAGRDVIHGLGGDDIIYGFDGDDVICGGAGDDVIYGGKKRDVLVDDEFGGVPGDDKLYGGLGNDRLVSWLGTDDIRGGDGDDDLDLNSGGIARGGAGNDTLSGTGKLMGQADSDIFGVSANADDRVVVVGGPGNDFLRIFGGHPDGEILAFLGSGDDDSVDDESRSANVVHGGTGDDYFGTTRYSTLANPLRYNGGPGNDFIQGASGNDVLNGGPGNDLILGDREGFDLGASTDIIRGGDGDDILIGDTGTASASADTISGGAGNDLCADEGLLITVDFRESFRVEMDSALQIDAFRCEAEIDPGSIYPFPSNSSSLDR